MIIASIEFATATQHGDRGWNGAYVPIDIKTFIIHPAHEMLYHTTGAYASYLLRTAVWVLLRPTRTEQWKSCGTRPMVLRPYPRGVEC